MQPKVLKYLLDIESIISEIEIIKTSVGNDFSAFNDNVILQRAVERELEIIGEAEKNCLKSDPIVQSQDQRRLLAFVTSFLTHMILLNHN